MKLKLTILTVFLSAVSLNAFGQTTEPAKTPAKTETPKVSAVPTVATTVKMPTAKEILDKYVESLGGRAANEKIKSRSVKGTIELSPMNIKGTVEGYSAAPDKSYSKVTLAGIGEIIDSFDGTTAWTINPLQGNHDKTGDELAQTKLLSDFYRDINLDKLYSNLTVKGIEKIGEKEAYAVTGTPAGLEPETFYFDTKTGYLLRSDMTAVSPEGRAATKTFYEDIRDVDGVKIPFKIRTVLPQFELITTVTEVKNNPAIDDKLFSKPK